MKFPSALLFTCGLMQCPAQAGSATPVDGVLNEFRVHPQIDSYLFVAVSPARVRFAARFEIRGEGDSVSCQRSVFTDEGYTTDEKLVGEDARRVAKLLRGFDWNVRSKVSETPFMTESHVPASRLILKHRHGGIYREIESTGDAVPGLLSILEVVTSKK